MVFVILFFIFILQTVWLFIAELAGKDLDFWMVIKFLLFATPRIIPLVLPLSVLLSSIMTFGNLAESYEFSAMKSAGISLQRALKTLSFFIFFLSIIAFIFANNVIPYAEYKFINFRKNIAQSKPALAIAEGQFSNVGSYTIKVNKKSGQNGNTLSGITIHKKSIYDDGNKTVIKSHDGELVSSKESNTLKLVLNDGYYYEDIKPKKFEDRYKIPFAKSSFKKYVINIDLSKLNNSSTNDEKITNTHGMLNVAELNYTLDSLHKNINNDILNYSENSTNDYTVLGDYSKKFSKKVKSIPNDLLSLYSNDKKLDILNMASSNMVSKGFSIESTKSELEFKQKNINNHLLALYEKFIISFACFLMFFIGAPLGAIIKKGGIGLPIVFAVLIFITFHFINTFGKRISQQDGLSPFLGAWMSSIILTPLAVLLTYRATNDIGLINIDAVLAPFQKFYKSVTTKEKMEQSINQKLVSYYKHAKIALVLNIVSIIFFFVAKNNPTVVILIIIEIILLLSLYYFIYISQYKIDEIGGLIGKSIEPGISISIAVGYPFYFFLYLYNYKIIKENIIHH
jgi:lipopolysaccharide export system permease protein